MDPLREAAVVEVLQSIQRVEKVNIIEKDGTVFVGVAINGLQITIQIDNNGRIYAVQIHNGPEHITKRLPEILEEAKTLQAPQDLRFVVFTLKNLIHREEIILQHISDISDECVVKNDATNDKVQVLTADGIKCTIQLHMNYPEVPGGVLIDSLTIMENNTTITDKKQIESNMKKEVNCCLYRTIPELVRGLKDVSSAALAGGKA